MINLKSIKNQKFNGIRLVEILFYTFPLWFIVGNLAVSINTLLFIIVSLILIKRKRLAYRFDNAYWLLIIFFLYLFVSTLIQFQKPGVLNLSFQDSNATLENNPIFKSFLLVRYLLLIFVIDTLLFNKLLDLKKLFLFSLFCTTFVSLDVLLQYFSGYDLFGFKSKEHWNSGPFGDELIASSYLLYFSFFSIFYLFKTLENNNSKFSILIFIIVIHLLATLVAGNRMPLILFMFGCGLIILFIKNFRFIMFISLVIFLSISVILAQNNSSIKNNYIVFFKNINLLQQNEKSEEALLREEKAAKIKKKNLELNHDLSLLIEDQDEMAKDISILRHSGHNRIFRMSIMMWKEQPLTGFGLKSFRVKCWDLLKKDTLKFGVRPQKIACSNHSHNFYLQFLSETGIIGTSLLVIFFLILLKDCFGYLVRYNKEENSDIIFLIPVVILFFIEIWPLRTSGNFFTNWDATFFWLNASILLAARKKRVLNL